ncbi:hypothetical protein BC826DRAFT_11810 [Russula brevipes]|nr:hypothetical protein BC826DRAFT_11810 [Russula brevipes]
MGAVSACLVVAQCAVCTTIAHTSSSTSSPSSVMCAYSHRRRPAQPPSRLGGGVPPCARASYWPLLRSHAVVARALSASPRAPTCDLYGCPPPKTWLAQKGFRVRTQRGGRV